MKKTQPVELNNATYDDMVNGFIKEYDLPPQLYALITDTLRHQRSRIALWVFVDSALWFAKQHPDKVVINPPSPPPSPSSQPLLHERTTHYVG